MDNYIHLTFRILRRGVAYVFLVSLSAVSVISGKRIIIIVNEFGELGNRLFLFANILAFAAEHNAIVLNAGFRPWRGIFEGTRPGMVACYPKLPLPHIPGDFVERCVQHLAWAGRSIAGRATKSGKWASLEIDGEEMCWLNNPRFVRWASTKHVILMSGWLFISHDLFRLWQGEIRRYFRPLNSVMSREINEFQSLKQSCDIVVGVMIRHGDYRHWLQGTYFFDTSAYVRWMRQAVALFSELNLGFLITGNDDRIPEGIEDLPYVFSPHREMVTRILLAQCDFIIAPVSTYAGWSAFYGNVPIFLLHSDSDVLTKDGFKKVYGQYDLKDGRIDHFGPDIDLTLSLIGE